MSSISSRNFIGHSSDKSFRNDFDFENVRPKFAGHKQALPARIVRNAIQDGFRIASIRRTQQPVNINPSHNGAILRRNPRDPIAVPYVRKIWPSTNSSSFNSATEVVPL
jgi:hypothetical protein